MPCAVVCSDEFGPLGRAEAEVLGMAGLPLVAIPHPLAGNDAGLVRAKAHSITTEILSALSDPVAELEARYAVRFLTQTERRLHDGALCVDAVCAVDPGLSVASR